MRLLLLLLLLCGCTVHAAEFRVTCPKCATPQRLTPMSIVVTGTVRTNGGFMDERTLKFRCEQRRCRFRFESQDSVFRKEVKAIAIPPSLTAMTSTQRMAASAEDVSAASVPVPDPNAEIIVQRAGDALALTIQRTGTWALQISKDLRAWQTAIPDNSTYGNSITTTADYAFARLASVVGDGGDAVVGNLTVTGEAEFLEPAIVQNLRTNRPSYSAAFAPVNYQINRGGNAPENGGGASYGIDCYSFFNERFDWACGVQGFVTGVAPGSAEGVTGIVGVNSPGSTNIGTTGVGMVGNNIRGVGLVGRILPVELMHQGIGVARTNAALRLDCSSPGWLFYATTDNTNPVAKLERNGNFYTRGQVFTNWNGQ